VGQNPNTKGGGSYLVTMPDLGSPSWETPENRKGSVPPPLAGAWVLIAQEQPQGEAVTIITIEENDLMVTAVIESAVVVNVPDSGKKPPKLPPLACLLCVHGTDGGSWRHLRVPPQNGLMAMHSPSGESTLQQADSQMVSPPRSALSLFPCVSL
jgi:hypothetical protein